MYFFSQIFLSYTLEKFLQQSNLTLKHKKLKLVGVICEGEGDEEGKGYKGTGDEGGGRERGCGGRFARLPLTVVFRSPAAKGCKPTNTHTHTSLLLTFYYAKILCSVKYTT